MRVDGLVNEPQHHARLIYRHQTCRFQSSVLHKSQLLHSSSCRDCLDQFHPLVVGPLRQYCHHHRSMHWHCHQMQICHQQLLGYYHSHCCSQYRYHCWSITYVSIDCCRPCQTWPLTTDCHSPLDHSRCR